MSKILLVEDDNNLREIYDARLQAEGYDIVSASDGEEALVVAKREHPDLIISDVMMPKISGFEMLDILRNAEDLRDVKVIMLTALGQAEDQKRADSLGADRYLVKSQVTLEDIVRVSQELLSGADAATSAQAAAVAEAPAPATAPAATPAVPPLATQPVAVEPEPVSQTASEPLAPAATPEIPVATAPEAPEAPVESTPQMPPTPASTAPKVPTADDDTPAAPETGPEAEAAVAADDTQTSAQEEKAVEDQIADFIRTQSADALPATDTSLPEPITVTTPAEAAPETETTDPASATTTTPEQDKALADALSNLGSESLTTPAKTPAAPAAEATASETAAEPTAESAAAPEVPATEPAPAAPEEAPQIKRGLAAVAPAAPDDEDAPATEPAPTATTPKTTDNEDDDVPVHHSKVIQPLSDEAEGSKKSLDELLAEEDAKDSGLTLPTAVEPNLSLNAKPPAAEPVIPEAPTEITPDTFGAPETDAAAEPVADTTAPTDPATAPADASKPKTDFDPNSVAL